MSNLEKIQEIFKTVFNVGADALNEDFTAENTENWDSVTQMSLVTGLEETFDIMLDVDDVQELDSYNKCLTILKKYEVEV